MPLKLTEQTMSFLKQYLPGYEDEGKTIILDALYDLIDERGFAPPDYHEYNDFGREAQKAYDDIYWNNL